MKVLAPDDILAESFRIIDAEIGAHDFGPLEWPIVRRMIHASGDLEIAHLVEFRNNAAEVGVNAFQERVPIVTDVRMVYSGINTAAREALGSSVHCFLGESGLDSDAASRGITRCAMAMERAIASFPEAVFVIGNAPTALSALANAIHQGSAKPRMIVAMPVGFVGVVESKAEALSLGVPIIAMRGRRGGSAVAAATVNALLLLAKGGMPP